MLERHRYLLIANRTTIGDDLLVEDILSELRSTFILNLEDSEVISSEKTSRSRAERLLDILPEKGYDAFGCFYESLLEKYPHLAQLLAEGVPGTQYDENNTDSGAFVDNTSLNAVPMTNVHRNLLTAKRVDIVEDLLVDDVLGELESKFVFGQEDIELIRYEKTNKCRAEKLLDLLVTKGDQAFGHFLVALRNPYPHIAELLEAENLTRERNVSFIGDLQDIVESKLREGGVPQRPTVFTNRPRRLHSLRTAMRSLKDRDAWVVLHGMAGCGKTVLATEAVRNVALLEDCFPGGVFWINVGPVDRPKLLMKMQNLCSRLDEDKMRPLPRNLEEARDRLKMLFSQQYPRSLLVVDDLWSAHDARYFDIRARLLVTTRDVSISQCIEGVKCPVFVPAELSRSQCLDILSQWTNKKRSELPSEASDIIAECGGHALAISMIGALLKAHPTRWFYYWSQLHNHRLSKVKTNFAYDYPSVSEAIAMSIESLSNEFREKYLDFVLFDSSINIPLKVFCLLWDMEKEDVEDIMDEFLNKSLLKSACCEDRQYEHSGYAVHNLQVNYLLENCKDIEARHKRLVMSYSKACRGNFSNLEDDGYVYLYLVHHLLQAQLADIAKDLLTNLTWVARKLEVAGPADIINDYINVIKFVEEEEKGEFRKLEDFYHFVRTNAHLFVSRPVFDVVQAALSEPVNNEVYKQAKIQAIKKSKELYIDWCNKHEETAYSLEMTLKPHNGAISCCCFSSDGKHVVSASSDETAKVWEAASGKVIHSLDGHDGVVTSCAFNHDNTKVLTTSYDTSVKIWKLSVHHELMLTYNDHKQDIYCGAFCPGKGKETVVISCSADHTIRIWSCEEGNTTAVCKGHSDVVRWCCFSRDGEKIASGSHDQTVKIWRTDTGECLVTTPKHDTFVSYCCFDKDGSRVFATSATCIKIWDSVTGEARDSLDINYSVLAFSLSHCGNKIAFALDNATIQLWDLASKKELTTYHGHKNWVHTVNFSPDDSQLVSGSADETVKVWPTDTTAYAKRAKLQKIFDVFFGGDQIIIAVADSQNRMKIFEGLEAKEKCEGECNASKINDCVFSPDGKDLAMALKSGEIKVLSVETCQVTVQFLAHDCGVNSLCYNKSGSKLLSCSDDKSFMVWDAKAGKGLLNKETRHSDAVTVAVFFNNDSKIATSSKDGTAKVWDSTNGKLLFTCHHEENEWVLCCKASTDDTRLVTGTVNSVIKIWDASSGQELFNVSPHLDCVRSLAISGNNQVIASGSDDGTVMISSLHDGHQIVSCTPQRESWVTDVVFSKDSSQLVSIGNGIHWHQVSDGSLLQQFSVKGSYLRQIKCSEDFKTFVTVDNLGILYILEVIS